MKQSGAEKCAFSKLSNCSGGISREHYISQSVLNLLSDSNGVKVHGTPWANGNPVVIGKSSLTANILCGTHNSNLSPLDSNAARFFKCIQEAQTNLATNTPSSRTNSFSGEKLELWFLKVSYMMWYSGNLGKNGKKLKSTPPDLWAEILHGDKKLPDHWGLYIPIPNEPISTVDTEFECVSLSTENDEVLGVHFGLARIPFMLVCGKPDNVASFGIYRPQALVLRKSHIKRTLRLNWQSNSTDLDIEYNRIGP